MNSFTRDRRSVVGMPAPVIAAIGLAWALAFAIEAGGRSDLMAHDQLLDGVVPIAQAVAIQLAGWAAMVVAMMLPTAVPLLRLFRGAAAGQERPGAATSALVGGYLLVWMGFGALAFGLDVVLHALVESNAVLHSAEWAIGGATLAMAGLFQFSALKDACLQECRHPAAFLLRYYQRGVGGGLLLGIRHGIFCVGCCWALMLVMFAVGVTNLDWMAVLTAVMVNEKTRPSGRRSVPVTGVALLGVAAVVLANSAHAAGILN
jgi:predicted metal-binding membrane protein